VSAVPPLAVAILQALAEEGADAVSLPRLGKRLQLEASTVMRQLSLMGSARIGGQAGPGWVLVEHVGERWMVRLTEAGLAQAGRITAP
jgi:FdhD protein